MTNTELLAEKIRQSGYKLQFIADQCELDRSSLRRKILNESEFRQSEIMTLVRLLNLSDTEKNAIFFAD